MTVAWFGHDTLLRPMRRSPVLGIVLSGCLFIPQSALGTQTGDSGSANNADRAETETFRKGDTELGMLVAWGIAHDLGGVGNRQFLAFGGRLGRILTRPSGPGFLRGNLEIAMELLPVFLMFQETTVYGFSSTLLLRHYFSPTAGSGPSSPWARVPFSRPIPFPRKARVSPSHPKGASALPGFKDPGSGISSNTAFITFRTEDSAYLIPASIRARLISG